MKIEWWDIKTIMLAIGISRKGSVNHGNQMLISKVDRVLNGLSFIKILS